MEFRTPGGRVRSLERASDNHASGSRFGTLVTPEVSKIIQASLFWYGDGRAGSPAYGPFVLEPPRIDVTSEQDIIRLDTDQIADVSPPPEKPPSPLLRRSSARSHIFATPQWCGMLQEAMRLMSAHRPADQRCPFCPRKRTCSASKSMSALCQKRTRYCLLRANGSRIAAL